MDFNGLSKLNISATERKLDNDFLWPFKVKYQHIEWAAQWW